MTYIVRNAVWEDLPRIEEIYAYARSFMASTGNPNQWGKTNPPTEQLKKDIENRLLFVVTEDTEIHGVFYFYIGTDLTYHYIEDGQWHSDKPYGTIHRIAGDGSGGILKTAVEFCSKKIDHLRIDTHHDNLVMQRAVEKVGFQRCGIIYIADGSPRIAYDRLEKQKKTVYFDQTSVDGCVGIFSSTANVIPAGTGVYAMPVKYRDAAYMELEKKLGIHFIFADNVPAVPFYAVPYFEVVAFDDRGGFIGFRNDDGPLFYIDREWNCFRMAPDIKSLLTLTANWKEKIVPVEELHLYPSKETAMDELEFIDVKEIMQ